MILVQFLAQSRWTQRNHLWPTTIYVLAPS